MKRDVRPTGIIRTLPYFGAGEANEPDAMQKAYRRMMTAFRALDRGEDRPVYIALSSKPTQEVLHCYILVGGKVRVRANIAGYAMKPEQVISQFLREEFTDERLAILRADAVAGCVPYDDSTTCLVAHAREDWLESYRLPNVRIVEKAYLHLGLSRWWDWFIPYDSDGSRKMKRLIPLIDAEIARRAAAREEVVEKAREVVTQPSQSSLSLTQSRP